MSALSFPMSESERQEQFPICRSKIFLAHAGVTTLPTCVAESMTAYLRHCAESAQEDPGVWDIVAETRALCAELIDADADEIALLGPTSLGLSLVANGLDWQPGDEIVCHRDDYPANVYPWIDLRRLGVTVRYLEPTVPGDISVEMVSAALTPRTRLVALASAHYLSGTRIDIDAIGRMLRARGVLFCVDAIQTLGAYPLSVEHVDFLSADAHKWLLGPCAIGIVYVRREHFQKLRPSLLGAWNVHSPRFLAQDSIEFVPTAQRYEPGVLNFPGVYGLNAALKLILSQGLSAIQSRLQTLKTLLLFRLDDLGFRLYGVRGPLAHAITTFDHPNRPASVLYEALNAANVVSSLRHDRSGNPYLRFSPHFYNTEREILRACEALAKALG